MARHSNFDDATKARIFARDHATCCFSGKSLWVLDHGASYLWAMDWADHIRPVSRGGRSDVDNGVCSSYTMNAKKGANTRDQLYFFRNGLPTEDYFALVGRVPAAIATALRRPFKESDWYFNRALSHVMIAVEQIVFDVERERTRKKSYWAGAALKALEHWRKVAGRSGLTQMRARKLIPSRPTGDQELLIGLSKAASRKDIEEIILKLVPYYKRSVRVIESLARVRTARDAQRLRRSVLKNRRLSPDLRSLVLDNIAVLFPAAP